MPGFDNDCAFFGKGIDTRGLDPATNPVVNQMDADGKLLIGAAAFPYIRASFLTEGSGIKVINSPGSITIAADKESTDLTLTSTPMMTAIDSATYGDGPSVVNGATNLMLLQEGEIMEHFVISPAVDNSRFPYMDSTGLIASRGLVNTNGAEFNWGMRPNAKHAYTMGIDAFYLEWRFRIADVSGVSPVLCGFRKQQANNANYLTYTDYALIGVNNSAHPEQITIEDRLNSGTAFKINTSDGWIDGATHTLRIQVNISGAVTYTIDGLAPSATHNFSFDNGDIVSPCFLYIFSAAAPGQIHWISVKAGLQ